MAFFTVMLPGDSIEKLTYAIAIFIGFIYLQSVISNILPKSKQWPLISLYLIAALILSAFNLSGNCLIVCIQHFDNPDIPPRLIKVLVIDILGIILLHNLYRRITWALSKISKSRQTTIKTHTLMKSEIRSPGDPAESQGIQSPTQETIEFQEIHGGAAKNELEFKGKRTERKKVTSWKEVGCVLNRLLSLIYFVCSILILFKYLVPLFQIFWSRSAESE